MPQSLVVVARYKEALGFESLMTEVMNELSEERAARKVRAATLTVPELIDRALQATEVLSGILPRIDRVLLLARSEAETLVGRVWQDRMVMFFKALEPSLEEISQVSQDFDEVYLGASQPLVKLVNQVRRVLLMPRKATVEYAISDIDFGPNPNTGREGISYSLPLLKEWASSLTRWLPAVRVQLKLLKNRAERL